MKVWIEEEINSQEETKPTCLNIVHAPEFTQPTSRNFWSVLWWRLGFLADSPSSLRITDFEGTGSDRIAQATFVWAWRKKFVRREPPVQKKTDTKHTNAEDMVFDHGVWPIVLTSPTEARLQCLSINQA